MVGNSVAEEDASKGQEVEPKGCIDSFQSSVEEPAALVAEASRTPVYVNEVRFVFESFLAELVPGDIEAGRVRCSDLPCKQIIHVDYLIIVLILILLNRKLVAFFVINEFAQRKVLLNGNNEEVIKFSDDDKGQKVHDNVHNTVVGIENDDVDKLDTEGLRHLHQSDAESPA